MVEKGIRGRICPSIYRHAKANNKYMKDYDNNKDVRKFFRKVYWIRYGFKVERDLL